MIESIRLLNFAFAFSFIWTILVIAEGLTRLGLIHGEVARKSMHIAGGVFIASTPLFMNRTEIILLNAILFVGFVVISGLLHLSKSVDSVSRWTVGQYVYPLGVILTALIYNTGAVFAFAVLVLAFADGFAAILGRAYGRVHYHLFGGNKTILGTTTFFIIAATLFALYMFLEGDYSPQNLALVFIGAAIAAMAEGLIAGGFDNLVVPVVAGAILTQL